MKVIGTIKIAKSEADKENQENQMAYRDAESACVRADRGERRWKS